MLLTSKYEHKLLGECSGHPDASCGGRGELEADSEKRMTRRLRLPATQLEHAYIVAASAS
jgi:hypothetical protein